MDEGSYKEGLKIVSLFTRMRWLAILLILYVIVHLKLISLFNFPWLYCLAIIALGSVFNALYPYFARLSRPLNNWLIFIYLAGTFDMLFVTLLVHFTGGVSSPFVYLYLILLVAGSIFGFSLLDYLLSCQIAVFFMINCLLEALAIIPHYPPGPSFAQPFSDFGYLSGSVAALLLTCLLATYISSFLTSQLREKQKYIEELSKAQLDFMNAVMHESKSPLTSVLGYIDLLTNQSLGPVTEKQKETLLVIKRQSQRILALANDLLSLARLESGFSKVDKKPLNLAEVINHVYEEIHPQFDERRISLVQEIEPKTPVVMLDEDKISEVLINLFSNAIKFSNDGDKIFISVALLNREIMVAVRDEGIGIEPGDLQRIFEKFYRASKESAERKGTGLGLTLSRAIIEAHGGRMWAVSAGRNQGAVFYFTLPL